LCITGSGTNEFIWMTDENPTASTGITQWALMSDGTVATNDTGTTVVTATNNSGLTLAPYDISIDTNGNIYTIQYLTNSSPSNAAVMSFPPYPGYPETNATWAVGAGNPNFQEAYGISVDRSATYVAVAFRGTAISDPTQHTGMLGLFYATNGQFFTNLDDTVGDQYTDVAWDNIGNLYALDTTSNVWRVYSPPGSNQATTVAVPIIEAYSSFTPPLLDSADLSTNGISFTLEGQSYVTYWIQQSPDLMNWTSVATNFSADADRRICIPFADNQDFYRAVAPP
jgi:hypothetical protein